MQANLDGLRWFKAYCQLSFYDVENEVQHCWALAAMRAAWVAGSLKSGALHCRWYRVITDCKTTESHKARRHRRKTPSRCHCCRGSLATLLRAVTCCWQDASLPVDAASGNTSLGTIRRTNTLSCAHLTSVKSSIAPPPLRQRSIVMCMSVCVYT